MHKKYIYAWKCGLNCIFTDFSCGAHFFVLGAPAPLYPEVLFERMAQVVAVEVRIDFGGEDAFVSEHLLYLPDTGAPFEQVRGERVPERMRADVFVDAGALGGLFQDQEQLFLLMLAVLLIKNGAQMEIVLALLYIAM